MPKHFLIPCRNDRESKNSLDCCTLQIVWGIRGEGSCNEGANTAIDGLGKGSAVTASLMQRLMRFQFVLFGTPKSSMVKTSISSCLTRRYVLSPSPLQSPFVADVCFPWLCSDCTIWGAHYLKTTFKCSKYCVVCTWNSVRVVVFYEEQYHRIGYKCLPKLCGF